MAELERRARLSSLGFDEGQGQSEPSWRSFTRAPLFSWRCSWFPLHSVLENSVTRCIPFCILHSTPNLLLTPLLSTLRLVPPQTPASVTPLVTSYLESEFAKLGSKNKLEVELLHDGKPWVADWRHWNYTAAMEATKVGVFPVSCLACYPLQDGWDVRTEEWGRDSFCPRPTVPVAFNQPFSVSDYFTHQLTEAPICSKSTTRRPTSRARAGRSPSRSPSRRRWA